jgi:hypothetical protein
MSRALRMTEQELAALVESRKKPKAPPAPPAPPAPTHGEIMRAVRDLLRQCQIEHYPNVPGPISERGLPDITAIHEGRYVGIEVKKGKDTLSKDQKKWRDRIIGAKGLWIEARSVDDVIDGMGIRERFLL